MRVTLAKAGRGSHHLPARYAKHKSSWSSPFHVAAAQQNAHIGRFLSVPETSDAILYRKGPRRSTRKLPVATAGGSARRPFPRRQRTWRKSWSGIAPSRLPTRKIGRAS